MFKIYVRSPGDQEDPATDKEHLNQSSGGSWRGEGGVKKGETPGLDGCLSCKIRISQGTP